MGGLAIAIAIALRALTLGLKQGVSKIGPGLVDVASVRRGERLAETRQLSCDGSIGPP